MGGASSRGGPGVRLRSGGGVRDEVRGSTLARKIGAGAPRPEWACGPGAESGARSELGWVPPARRLI